MRTILHIGRHKTGTSSLQRFLSDHSEALSQAGYLYPQAGRQGIAHHKLAETYSRKNTRTRPEESAEARREILANMEAEKQPGHHTLILSSEAFQNAAVGMVAADFPAESTQIVSYIREQYDYMVSAYQQKVHAQLESCTLAEFSNSFSVNYDVFFSEWEKYYSQEYIKVGMFSRSSLRDGDIISDFIESAKIACPGIDGWSRPADQNPSIGGALLELKRAINQIVPVDGFPRKLYRWISVLAATEQLFRVKPLLSKSEIDRYRARHISSNNSFAAKYFPEKGSLFDISAISESQLTVEFADFLPLLEIARARVPEMVDFLSSLPSLANTELNLASGHDFLPAADGLDLAIRSHLNRVGRNLF